MSDSWMDTDYREQNFEDSDLAQAAGKMIADRYDLREVASPSGTDVYRKGYISKSFPVIRQGESLLYEPGVLGDEKEEVTEEVQQIARSVEKAGGRITWKMALGALGR